MTVELISDVFNLEMCPTSKLILIEVAYRANERGETTPDYEELASRVDVRIDEIQRWISAFKRDGVLIPVCRQSCLTDPCPSYRVDLERAASVYGLVPAEFRGDEGAEIE